MSVPGHFTPPSTNGNQHLGEEWATTESNRYEFNYRIEHELTDWLTIRQIGHYDEGKLDLFGINYGSSVAVNAITGSLWVTLEPVAGPFDRFGLGGGVFAASNRMGNLENSFSIGGFTRFDSSLWYKLADKVRVTVNVKNITNEYYISSTVSRAQITPREGRSSSSA
ncbi:TonB-dependent receptor [Sphingobium yanoikuyae]|jgi:TonB dependent receptor|uniref:TonB-dependent receptor n=1 Tax=Sphingobium yanoikuyae TaxID=13690 RepID=UPI0028A647D5|nr:TonB-dependent receptor [Sphingobium yanoikuyae]